MATNILNELSKHAVSSCSTWPPCSCVCRAAVMDAVVGFSSALSCLRAFSRQQKATQWRNPWPQSRRKCVGGIVKACVRGRIHKRHSATPLMSGGMGPDPSKINIWAESNSPKGFLSNPKKGGCKCLTLGKGINNVLDHSDILHIKEKKKTGKVSLLLL